MKHRFVSGDDAKPMADKIQEILESLDGSEFGFCLDVLTGCMARVLVESPIDREEADHIVSVVSEALAASVEHLREPEVVV